MRQNPSSAPSIPQSTGPVLREAVMTRRQLLQRAGGGFGLIGLAGLLADEGLLESAVRGADGLGDLALNPMAPRPAHFAGRAKRVIWVFINGGPSQVDTWDYKPALE